jgi:hypothetical protein
MVSVVCELSDLLCLHYGLPGSYHFINIFSPINSAARGSAPYFSGCFACGVLSWPLLKFFGVALNCL